MVLPIALGVVVFAGVIYMAVSKKSGFKVRLAALVALGLMVAAVIVSLIIIFGVAVAPAADTVVVQELPPQEPPVAAGQDGNVLLMFIVFLLAMFLFVFVLSMREQRKQEKLAKSKPQAGISKPS